MIEDSVYYYIQKKERLENFIFDISDDCFRTNEYFRIMKDKTF